MWRANLAEFFGYDDIAELVKAISSSELKELQTQANKARR